MPPTAHYRADLIDEADDLVHAERPSTGRWAIIAMVVATLVLLASPAAGVLIYGYPLMAIVLAAYLYRRNLASYVSLVCWLWFLTPLLRRILDYRGSWNQPAVVLLAPPLAVSVPIVWLIIEWRSAIQQRAAPLLCILATCLYATVLGLFKFPPGLVLQDLLTWLSPLVFGFMLCWHTDRAAELYKAFEKAFLYGLVVVGGYGLVQFFFLPRWDAAWMTFVNMDSIGKPLPTEVRVFSTMNGPQILASFLAVGLVIAFSSRSKIRYVSIPLGLLCLALSLARSGWVAAVAGTLYLLFTLPQRQRFRLVMAGILAAMMMAAALQNEDLQQVMSLRFESITDVRNDDSFMDRIDAYKALFDGFMDNPFGLGMGATPAIAEGTKVVPTSGWNQDLGDSTVAMIMTTMGVSGGLVVMCSLLLLTRRLFLKESMNPGYSHTMKAVLFGLIAEAALDGVISGPTGFLTWASVGFCLAFGSAGEESQSATVVASVSA
jgi:hypothetical protein